MFACCILSRKRVIFTMSRASYNTDWPQEVCWVLGESIQSPLNRFGLCTWWIDSIPLNRFINESIHPPWIDSLGIFPGKPDLGILNRSSHESIHYVNESIHKSFCIIDSVTLRSHFSHTLSLSHSLSLSPSHSYRSPITSHALSSLTTFSGHRGRTRTAAPTVVVSP